MNENKKDLLLLFIIQFVVGFIFLTIGNYFCHLDFDFWMRVAMSLGLGVGSVIEHLIFKK